MSQAKQFQADVEAFLKRSGMSPTTFGSSALKDPNFVRNLRAGRKPSLRTVDTIHDFIRSQDRVTVSREGSAGR